MILPKIDQDIQTATMRLLDESRFYGEILLRLKREYDDTLPGDFGLRWEAPYWVLAVNPDFVAETYQSVDEIKAALTHQVLHMVWGHPTRYGRELTGPDAKLVSLATDLAVNQYVTGSFPNEVTLQDADTMFKLQLPKYADSGQYFTILKPLLDTVENDGNGGTITSPDSHKGWSSGADAGEEASAAIRNIVADASSEATKAGRGHLPGDVERQILKVIAPRRNWKALLRQAMSNVPAGRQDNRSRFNRRQPYRMELPGQIASTQTKVAVYLDNSASISDVQAAGFLAEVTEMQRQLGVGVDVFRFDVAVTPVKSRQLAAGTRQAGGGTAFQAIFDDLAKRHQQPNNTVVIILTDGDGEESLVPNPYKRVLWLLPTGRELSLKQPVGQVVQMTFTEDIRD
jgi:predicted metal-dependent peptidase